MQRLVLYQAGLYRVRHNWDDSRDPRKDPLMGNALGRARPGRARDTRNTLVDQRSTGVGTKYRKSQGPLEPRMQRGQAQARAGKQPCVRVSLMRINCQSKHQRTLLSTMRTCKVDNRWMGEAREEDRGRSGAGPEREQEGRARHARVATGWPKLTRASQLAN